MSRSSLLAACLLFAACSSGAPVDVPPDDPIDGGAIDAEAAPDASPDAFEPETPDAGSAPDAAEPPDSGTPCNPLAVEYDCLLPYPSDVFLAPDDRLPSRRRVTLPPQGAPQTTRGEPVDPFRLHPADGFSHHPLILAFWPQPIDPTPLPGHVDPSASLSTASPTTILEADTGRPVLHFAELDALDEAEGRRALQIRPLVRLRNGVRYVVAIHGLRAAAGAPLPAPAGFRALRDGTAGGALSELAARYEADVFAPLTAFGLARADLQLAWDFTVESEAHVTRDMLAVRADAMRRFEIEPPPVTVDAVEEAGSFSADLPADLPDSVYRRVVGRMRVPLYMETDQPGAPLHRGPDGRPAFNGYAEAGFTLLIPRSVATGQQPARLLQFGHGFFGGRQEIETGFLHGMANRLGLVVAATDWWGMTTADAAVVAEALVTRPSEALAFTDRIHQGMVNFIALTYALRGPLALHEATRIGDRPAFDPAAEIYFQGISQGHILGGTYVALTPHVRRAVLEMGGASFGFMMSRAVPFGRFLTLLRVNVRDPIGVQKFIALVSPVLDRVDPITYAPRVLRDVYPGSPTDRRVLMHVGIGDTSVPELAAHLHARALGLALAQPSPRPLAGLEALELPAEGADVSVLVEVDFGLDPHPTVSSRIPERENCVHEHVRRMEPIQAQIDAFWRPEGRVTPVCDGVCRASCD